MNREEIEKLRKIVLADLALVRDPVVKACARRRLHDLDSEIERLDELAKHPRLFGDALIADAHDWQPEDDDLDPYVGRP